MFFIFNIITCYFKKQDAHNVRCRKNSKILANAKNQHLKLLKQCKNVSCVNNPMWSPTWKWTELYKDDFSAFLLWWIQRYNVSLTSRSSVQIQVNQTLSIIQQASQPFQGHLLSLLLWASSKYPFYPSPRSSLISKRLAPVKRRSFETIRGIILGLFVLAWEV